MTTPTPPPSGEDPTSRIPQTPPTGQAYQVPGAAPIGAGAAATGAGAAVPPGMTPPTPGTPTISGVGPVPPHHDAKDKSLPWKIATGVLAVTTLGLGVWGFSTNSKLNDLQASTDAQIAALQQQLKQVEQSSGAKEAAQAKEIAKLKNEVSDDRGRLKVEKAVINKEAGELKTLNSQYQKTKQAAAQQEGNLKVQLAASRAEANLAKQCATVLAIGINKIYADVPNIVTYKEVNQVIKAASASCNDLVSLQ